MSQPMSKCSPDTSFPEGENHKEPAKLPHSPESVTNRVTGWLGQVPPEDPDATYTGPIPALGSSVPLPGSVPDSLSSDAYTETIPGSASSEGQGESSSCRYDSTADEMAYLRRLQHEGASTQTVRNWFSQSPHWEIPAGSGLKVQCKEWFKRECVPGPSTGLKIERPRPDFTYGYDTHDGHMPFSKAQWDALGKMRPRQGCVNQSADLALPFLIVDVCAEGPGGDNLWVATNRLLGDSASCAKVVNGLNGVLRQYPNSPRVQETTFSIVLNQVVARLYVTWLEIDDSLGANEKGRLQYNTKRLERFDLEEEEEGAA
ncbi:hypothetical protein PG984_009880 [Apiospora sp. TS-2023a]